MRERVSPVQGVVPRLGGRTVSVDVEGGECVAEIAGQGPAILLLHGWTLDRRMWMPQFAALRGRYRLIAIDRRGFGQSSAPPGRDQEVEDIAAVADALGLKRFALAGMSQSGSTAIRFALTHPERIDRLVLQGISLAGVADRSSSRDHIPIAAFMAMAQQGRLDEMKDQWRRHPLMHTVNPAAAQIAEAMLTDYEGRDLLHRPAGPSASLEDVGRLTVPVLAVTGEEDTVWRRDIVSAIGRAADHASAHLLPKAGHLCNICAAPLYNTLLDGFLAADRSTVSEISR